MSTTKVVGIAAAIKSGATPPTNTKMLWHDTGVDIHFYWNGSEWTPVPAIWSGDTATPPPINSIIWFNTDDNTFNVWNGSEWIPITTFISQATGDICLNMNGTDGQADTDGNNKRLIPENNLIKRLDVQIIQPYQASEIEGMEIGYYPDGSPASETIIQTIVDWRERGIYEINCNEFVSSASVLFCRFVDDTGAPITTLSEAGELKLYGELTGTNNDY
jgi:hypothetical protein